MKMISLSQGYEAQVDDADYNLVVTKSWYAEPREHTIYARWKGSDGSSIYLHNFIMNAKGIDHIDGNGLNCQRDNLRHATQSQNIFARASNANRGVTYRERNRKKWEAQIKVMGKTIYLGSYMTEDEALAAYAKAAKEHFGEFA